jgi:hypothetical protein
MNLLKIGCKKETSTPLRLIKVKKKKKKNVAILRLLPPEGKRFLRKLILNRYETIIFCTGKIVCVNNYTLCL